MSVQPQVFSDLDALNTAGVGSTFTRSAIGWDVKWVDGGTTIFIQGPTITEALAGHGMQITHPEPRVVPQQELAAEEPSVVLDVPPPEERRAPDQDAAMVAAFISDTLPGEDRRSE